MGDFADDLIEQGINEMADDLYPLEEDDEGFLGDRRRSRLDCKFLSNPSSNRQYIRLAECLCSMRIDTKCIGVKCGKYKRK